MKFILNYKKPTFWIIIVAIFASVVVAICFLINLRTTLNDELSVFIDMQVAEHNYSEGHTDGNFVVTHHKILDVDETLNKTTVYMWSMYHEYSCENGKIQLEAGSHIPTVITAKRTGSHGHYELVEYWTPGDGSDYAKDIKAKFPWYLHSKAFDSQRYVDEQRAFCENAAKEYYSVSKIGGADEPTNVVVTVDSKQLKEKYPQFFNVSTDGGLTVYIWQMSKDNYSCYLANTSMEAISDNSFAYEVGATIEEMRAILTTYDIDRKDITIQPVSNPLSSYHYVIDDAYREKVEELFWLEENRNPTFEATVLEVYDDSVLVEPYGNGDGMASIDKVFVSTDLIGTNEIPKLKKGMKIRVVYNGQVAESYPPQLLGVFAIYEIK